MMAIWKTILTEWQEKTLPETFAREKELNLQAYAPLKKILVVTGFRRCGKTYLVYHTIKKLLLKYSRQDVVYINFEDERIPLKTEVLSNLFPSLQSLFGQKPKILFLDEIQNMPLWGKWVRRIMDNEETQIILTGSSSKMSSFELPTELRGRSFEQKINPLTFGEFLTFKQEKTRPEGRFEFLFNQYLRFGALPEIALAPDEETKMKTIQEYFLTTIRRDIMDRFEIKNEEPLKTVIKLLFNSTYFTLSKLYGDLKSQGVEIGKTTLNNYLSHFESSYLFQPILFYSPSMRDQLQHPRKAYFIDNGFMTALSTKFSQNYGRLLENLIYWQLKMKHEEIFYYQNPRKTDEVDFVIMKNGTVQHLIQVCYDPNEREIQKREFGALLRAGRKLKCDHLQIIAALPGSAVPPKNINLLSVEDFLTAQS